MSIQLMHGDCLELMKSIPDGSVDMILCDLPYGTTACKWDTVIPFEPLWAHYRRVTKSNAAIVLTAAQPFAGALASSNLEMLRYEWIWIKPPTLFQHAKNRPMSGHENVLVFSKAGWGHRSQMGSRRMSYNPQGVYSSGQKTFGGNHGRFIGERPNQVGKVYEASSGYPSTILRFPRDKDKIHPTQKPVALMEYLIRTYTNEGETVLDNCMGSGTTGVACVRTGRKFIGIEKDERYFQIAKNRIEQEQQCLRDIAEFCQQKMKDHKERLSQR